jgi:hypothetical protein
MPIIPPKLRVGDQIAGLVIGRFSSNPIVIRELLDHVVRTQSTFFWRGGHLRRRFWSQGPSHYLPCRWPGSAEGPAWLLGDYDTRALSKHEAMGLRGLGGCRC